MESSDEDILQPKEPQITSENAEDRVAARALRIQRRQVAFKKLEASKKEVIPVEIEGRSEAFPLDEEISPVEQQAAECAVLLEHLLADGEERVTNVRVANDAREVARRFSEAKKNKELLKKLEEEARLAQEKFEVISNNWNPILELNDPIEIDEEITKQKDRCNELISQKNAMIKHLKDEMKVVDDIFYADLQKQLNDIKELSERIDSQVQLIKNAYQSQLSLIEHAIEMERALTIDYNQKRWDALYKRRDKEEINNVVSKIEQIAAFEKKMDALTLEHREKFRIAKIQLETEIQVLYQELQHLKATCLINSEKIDYNFQVLKRREEENVFVRSQQKRKLNKMQDIVNALKKKIQSAEKESAIEEAKATKEICRLHDVMEDLQLKAEHFAHVNERKYQQLWQMNKEKANDLLDQIIQIDKSINETVLGKKYPEINVNILKQADLPSYKTAIQKINELGSSHCETDTPNEQIYSPLDDSYIKSKNKLVNHILNLIADSSGFLIEERLWPLLEKYESEPALICKLDNIFVALEIFHENDIRIMCQYFSKYTYCPICNKNEDSTINKDGLDDENQEGKYGGFSDKHLITSVAAEIKKGSGDHEIKVTKSEKLLVDEVEQILDCQKFHEKNVFSLDEQEDTTYKAVTECTRKCITVMCANGHDLKVSSVHVLNALQEFVSSIVQADILSKKPPISTLDTAISRSLKTEDVSMFWEQYKEAIPPQKDKLWDGLMFALSKYLPILQERQKVSEDVMQLRRQNSELRHLLKGQIPKNELPPARKFLSPISSSKTPPKN